MPWQDMTAIPTSPSRPAAPRGRLLPWLLVIVFLLQFLGATQHHHELTAKSPHCVSCTLHAQPHAAPPAALPGPAPFAWILLQRLDLACAATVCAARSAFLRPPAQGPPSFLST
jgi:hypothetical protein